MIMSKSNIANIILHHCDSFWSDVWHATDFIILITGGVTNVALLWFFQRERKSLSPSQVLGVNIVAMDLIYLSLLPISLFYDTYQLVNSSEFSDITWEEITPMGQAREIFDMFNLIGCPLLLACMCIERYLAVVKPVLYLRARKWEYRMAVSAVVWFVTLSFCLAAGLLADVTIMLMPVCLIISCLFIVMLACLGGVVWSLRQQSPAHATYGNQARTESPLKRQAVVNVLVVVVPAVISYFPVLVMAPVILCIFHGGYYFDEYICNISELSMLFPRFGVLIGPLFYLSKARQMWCLGGN